MNNRIVKYRIWDKQENRFRVLDTLSMVGTWFTIIDLNKSYDKFVIQQFTGLKDKHGKEIYEGDILKMEWMKRGNFITSEVKYGSGGFYLPKYDYLNMSVKHDEIPDGEVTGNIFENPELLT